MHSFPTIPKLIAVSAVFLGAVTAAFADDLNPPPWRLSNATATVQEWDFNTANLPLAPDGAVWGSGGGGFVNPYGMPLLTSSTSAIHLPTFATRNGVYLLPGGPPMMEFKIPNDPFGVGPKEIWIQVTWLATSGPFRPEVNMLSTAYSGPVSVISEFPTVDGWHHTTFGVTLPNKPSSEIITINNWSPVAIAIDQVVMDTICVPEPASLIAVAIGAAFLARRRRR